MSDFEMMFYSDLLAFGALLIARYVFGVTLFEWYVPAWFEVWLEPADLTGSDTLVVEACDADVL